MKRAAFTAYLKAKYAAINQLPDPQEQRLKEEPSTSETEYVGGMGVRPSDNPRAPSPYDAVQGPADTSLGVPISVDRAQRWKDRMVLAYDRIKKELTELPFFKDIYAEMARPFEKTEPLLRVFNDLINAYVVNVANSNLKDAFLFGVKYVAAFNDLRAMLPRMVKDRNREQMLEHGIWSTQKFIWRRVKDLLNIHDIGSKDLNLPADEAAEMRKILGKLPRGTWTYGPIADPTKPLRNQPKHPFKLERERIMKGE